MDYQALGVGLAALVTAVGTVIAGVYTGRSGKVKDDSQAYLLLEQAETERNIAIENATTGRIEALVQDASNARKRARELEDENDERYNKNRERMTALERVLVDERRHGQRGWDLASHHYGLVMLLSHMLNNIFTVVTLANGQPMPENLLGMVRNSMDRMKAVKIPISLESPLASDDTDPRQN